MRNIIEAVEKAMQAQKERIELLEWQKKELEGEIEQLKKDLEKAKHYLTLSVNNAKTFFFPKSVILSKLVLYFSFDTEPKLKSVQYTTLPQEVLIEIPIVSGIL